MPSEETINMKIMPWCQEHWDQLRKTIEDKGLGVFIAKDGQELANKITSKDENAFDPLFGSMIRINMKMMQSPGFVREYISKCPLCTLIDCGQPKLVANWLNGVTSEALEYAVQEGLVKNNDKQD